MEVNISKRTLKFKTAFLTLQKTEKENKKTILTGDFNLNLLKFEKSKEVTEFLVFLTAKCFTPQILGSTRITENEQASLIDHFFY